MPSVPSSYSDPANTTPIRALADSGNDYRALVCIFLFGGADAHNMVIPLDGNPNRAPYDAVRGANGVASASALPLGSSGWGLHPNMTDLKTRSDAGQLAVLLNVGPLREATTRSAYFSRAVKLPDQLFSHNSQQLTWQAAPGYTELAFTSGWMGRTSELAGSIYNTDPLNGILPTFSIAGRVLQMQGFQQEASTMQTTGAQTFGLGENRSVTGSVFTAALNAARIRQEWNNTPQRLFADRVRKAVANQTVLAANLATLPATPNGRFDALSSNSLAQQLRVVARIIASRASYQHRRDLFFVSLGGFDNHENLNGQLPNLLNTLDKAMGAFYLAMQDLSLQENVVAFTQSDFGRTLVINSTLGSDHGWGGHHLIMGGSVLGGVYGSTDLTVNGPLDTGQGRIIPTTSLEQYYGALLKWWGIPEAQLSLILPNIARFSPQTLTLAREPVSPLPTPDFDMEVMSGYTTGRIPSTLTYDPGAGGCRTMFNSKGELTIPPQNLCVCSDASVVPLTPPITNAAVTLGTVPGERWVIAGGGAGITTQVVGKGVNELGQKYIDVRWSGTNGGSVTYPHLYFGANISATDRVVVRPRSRMRVAVWAQVIAGSTAGFGGGPTPSVQFFGSSNNYLNDGTTFGNTANRTPNSTWRQCFTDLEITSDSAVTGVPIMLVAVSANATVDLTLRIAEPQLEYAIERFSSAEARFLPVSPYIETRGGAFHGPRFDYDPVTLQPLGLRTDRSATNVVTNSMFTTAVVGTPGTYPVGQGVTYGAGLTGIQHSLVRSGVERGMPFIDVRFWGTANVAGSIYYDLVSSASNQVATANSIWGGAVYLALKAGRLPSSANQRLRLQGRITGTFDSESPLGQSQVFDALRDAPITHQRFMTYMALSASANQVTARLDFLVALNEVVDFTIRIGAPMVCNLALATNVPAFIPTWGNSAGTGSESYRVAGTNFSSWYVAGPSTIAFTGASGMPRLTGMAGSVLAALTDGTANNRVGVAHIPDVGQVNGSLWSGGAQQFTSSAVSSVLPASRVTAAIAANTNDAIASARGTLGTADTSITLPSAINSINFAGSGSIVEFTSWIQRVRVWDARLTDAQLSLLTAQ